MKLYIFYEWFDKNTLLLGNSAREVAEKLCKRYDHFEIFSESNDTVCLKFIKEEPFCFVEPHCGKCVECKVENLDINEILLEDILKMVAK